MTRFPDRYADSPPPRHRMKWERIIRSFMSGDLESVPDFFLDDGTWLEVTLSENSAYKKVLRYVHQADELTVLWLDVDHGLHKALCQRVAFPNARVEPVDIFYDELAERAGGQELISIFGILRELKGIIL